MILFSLLSTSAPAAQNPTVVLETSMGEITLELYPDKAPATVKNFLDYVDEKFYDGLVFHRVIRGFMIQGGGMDAQMKEKATHAPIVNEADNGLKNDRGTIAMARTPDPNSATAQFFINAKDNTFLNFRSKTMDGYGYCVFGKVTKGMDVVDAIEAVPTGNKGFHQDVPLKPVLIKKAYRVKEKKGASS
ncbi:MAG TPA: peptidylprolyl isomerase [Deltaproteobacteria bacterium]|nr:peptidylprolyl isomerase [Deltaproteobacteria bacterium]